MPRNPNIIPIASIIKQKIKKLYFIRFIFILSIKIKYPYVKGFYPFPIKSLKILTDHRFLLDLQFYFPINVCI